MNEDTEKILHLIENARPFAYTEALPNISRQSYYQKKKTLKSELVIISKIVEASGFTLKLEPKKIELTQEQYRFFQKMKGSYNFDDDKHIE